MDYDLNRIVKKFKVISRWSFDKLPPGYLVVSNGIVPGATEQI